jgi:hypothetical protein
MSSEREKSDWARCKVVPDRKKRIARFPVAEVNEEI